MTKLRTLVLASVVLIAVGGAAFWFYKPGLLPTGLISQSTLQLSASPAALDFPTLPLGRDAQELLVLTNVGDTAIEIERFEASTPFSAATPPMGLYLEAGESHFLNVIFQPEVHGVRTGSLRVLAKSGETFEVALKGSGAAPADLKVEPRAVAFGDVAVGTTATALITIQNLSESEYKIPAGLLGGDFKLDDESIPLSGGESRTVKLQFTPLAVGERSGSLLFQDESGERDLARVDVSGSGVDSPLDLGFSASPLALDFGDVPVGSAREGWLTLRNLGIDDLKLVSITLPRGFSSPAGNRTIQAGRSLSFPVKFTPAKAGEYAGRAILSTNVPDEGPTVIHLSAKGTAGRSGATERAERGSSEEPRDSRFGFWDRSVPNTQDFDFASPEAEPVLLEPVGEVPEFAENDNNVPDPIALPVASMEDGSSVELIGYQQDVGSQHVGEIVIDRSTGRVQLSEVALPKVRGPFHEWWQVLPTDAVGSVNSLGDIEVSIPV